MVSSPPRRFICARPTSAAPIKDYCMTRYSACSSCTLSLANSPRHTRRPHAGAQSSWNDESYGHGGYDEKKYHLHGAKYGKTRFPSISPELINLEPHKFECPPAYTKSPLHLKGDDANHQCFFPGLCIGQDSLWVDEQIQGRPPPRF